MATTQELVISSRQISGDMNHIIAPFNIAS
jgi:hypothetical protein